MNVNFTEEICFPKLFLNVTFFVLILHTMFVLFSNIFSLCQITIII